SNLTEPPSALSCPLTMLKVVDFPAPLGPISARSSPAARLKSTPSTARTPPNDLLNPLTVKRLISNLRGSCRGIESRLGSGVAARRAPLVKLLDGACNTLRKQQHQQQDDSAQHRTPEIRIARDGIVQPCK